MVSRQDEPAREEPGQQRLRLARVSGRRLARDVKMTG